MNSNSEFSVLETFRDADSGVVKIPVKVTDCELPAVMLLPSPGAMDKT